MAVYFFDTSGIVKRYIREMGTAWVQAVTAQTAGNLIFLARITAVEVTSAVTRRQRAGDISLADAATILGQFRLDLLSEYALIEITPSLLANAMRLAEIHGLRAYDAVQLGVAVELHSQRLGGGLPPITLVSSDQELNTAARAAGLAVEDPNVYP